MSFLDGLFRGTGGEPELLVSPTVITADATVGSGYLHAVAGSGDDIALTLASTLVATVAGKRIALKVSEVDPEGGELSLTVPGGMTIEDDDGQFVSTFGISSMALGDYREWLCDAEGNWFLVAGAGGGGGGVVVVDDDDELRPAAQRVTLRSSDTVTLTVTADGDNNGVFVDAFAHRTAFAAVSAEALAAGSYVYIAADGVRLADKEDGHPAIGFVLDGVAEDENVDVYVAGLNTELSGLTAGTDYYLDTGGDVTASAAASGEISQRLGVAVSTTALVFAPGPSVLVA